MIFTDGECPICETEQLHLNTSDLLECPKCSLQLSALDSVITAVMPKLGIGKYRFEDIPIKSIHGAGISKAKGNSPLPDDENIFFTKDDLLRYFESLKENIEPIEKNMLWYEFKQNFRDFIDHTSTDVINDIAISKPRRTKYYQEEVMPYIAEKLKLLHGKEEFKVDYVMSHQALEDVLIPKIYIESENEFKKATHEIKKLCSLNSELRVLITAFLGLDDHKIYNQLREWQHLIRMHKRYNKKGFIGTISLIIAVITTQKIKFRSCSFWDDGDLRQPLDEFLVKHR
jgi:hypothetical protein